MSIMIKHLNLQPQMIQGEGYGFEAFKQEVQIYLNPAFKVEPF